MKITYESGYRAGHAILVLAPETHAEQLQVKHLLAQSKAVGIPLLASATDWDSMSNDCIVAHLSLAAIPDQAKP